jgi:hypothetical protein
VARVAARSAGGKSSVLLTLESDTDRLITVEGNHHGIVP